MSYKKCHCGCTVFKVIETGSCDICRANGAWDDFNDKYTHNAAKIKRENLERTQVNDEGECDFGISCNAGCWIFECTNCDCSEMIPRVEY
jgi:hypothetical protein